MKTQLTLLSLMLTAITSQAYADTIHSVDRMPTAQLPEITITATRTKTPIKNTIAQTTVINEEALQRYQGQSVLDVLRQQGGFYVTQNGGDGTASGIRLRGYTGNQVLVLVDGVRYSSVTTGSSALSLIPADQIDRIEILHGASGSSLYGADAMGGVIQIFTKGQNANQSNVAVTLGAGTEESYKAQVTGQYVNQATTLSLSGGYEKTDGIDATKPYAQFNAHHPDNDGFESKNASLVAKHRINEAIEIGLSGLYAKSTTDYDSSAYDFVNNVSLPYANTYSDQKNGTVSGFVNYSQDNFSAELKYGQSFDKSTAYDGNTQTGGQFDTTQDQATLQLGYQLPLGKIIGGYEHLKQEIESTANYAQKERTIKSIFAGYQLATADYDAQLAVRNDDNSQFGNETTYSLGGAYRIVPNVRVGASYATGFVVPSFNFLYYPFGANPNLKAETSKNTEVFVEYDNDLQKTRLTAYQSDVTDKIVNDANFIPQNIDEVDIKGVSLVSDWQINNILFGLNYDYVDTEDKAGKQLAYQPTHKGLVYVGYQQPEFDIRAEVQHIGERFTNASNTSTLDSYTLLNISGNYYLNKNLTLNARLNNLTSEDYETVYGYNQKGINAFISATYKWF